MASNVDRTDPEGLLSPDQDARMCGLSRRAVYDAIKRGELRAFRLCSRLRISGDQLDAWLRASAVNAPPRRAEPDIRQAPLASPGSFRAKLAAGNNDSA